MSSVKPRAQFGDRVERAIEDRADLVDELEEEGDSPGLRRRVTIAGFWLTVCGISLYLVGPTVMDTLNEADQVQGIAPGWLAAMAGLQILSNACLWELQRIALRTKDMTAVATSQLAGNGLAKVAPGGGALGAALQYRMLVQAGLPRATSASALTASNLLVFAVVLALPVLAIPAIAGGAVNHRLIQATLIGVLVFLGLFGVGVAMLAFDRPLLATGRLVQRVRNRMRRRADPLRGLPDRLVAERDRILTTLGRDWKRALAATVGRWAFDYATLIAALAAVGSNPRPSLVLLAFCAAQVLAQIPVTPGGLGFVEAGLTATLALAGVSPQDALVATFAYRLFSYWLMLPVGLGALGLHRLALRRRAAAT